MTERLKKDTVGAVLNYYEAAKKGYWNDLGGVCHYGYSNLGDNKPFDMSSAQLKMEMILGETLRLPTGSKVLDAGCGYSPVARTLTKEFGYNVTGIDLIHERLKNGRQINTDKKFNINLDQADYHHLPFPDNSFDGIYTIETLVHAYDLELVLSEFKRVLKPGGTLVLFEYSIPKLDSVPKIARNLAERVIRNTDMASLPRFTHGSFPQILKQAGFENAEAVDISKNVWPSWYHLWKYAAGITFKEFKKGSLNLDKIPGSLWIWPARRKLGYIISRAIKPQV